MRMPTTAIATTRPPYEVTLACTSENALSTVVGSSAKAPIGPRTIAVGMAIVAIRRALRYAGAVVRCMRVSVLLMVLPFLGSATPVGGHQRIEPVADCPREQAAREETNEVQ